MEHPVSDSKYTSLLLFDVFQDALADLIASDKYLFTRQKKQKRALPPSDGTSGTKTPAETRTA